MRFQINQLVILFQNSRRFLLILPLLLFVVLVFNHLRRGISHLKLLDTRNRTLAKGVSFRSFQMNHQNNRHPNHLHQQQPTQQQKHPQTQQQFQQQFQQQRSSFQNHKPSSTGDLQGIEGETRPRKNTDNLPFIPTTTMTSFSSSPSSPSSSTSSSPSNSPISIPIPSKIQSLIPSTSSSDSRIISDSTEFINQSHLKSVSSFQFLPEINSSSTSSPSLSFSNSFYRPQIQTQNQQQQQQELRKTLEIIISPQPSQFPSERNTCSPSPPPPLASISAPSFSTTSTSSLFSSSSSKLNSLNNSSRTLDTTLPPTPLTPSPTVDSVSSSIQSSLFSFSPSSNSNLSTKELIPNYFLFPSSKVQPESIFLEEEQKQEAERFSSIQFSSSNRLSSNQPLKLPPIFPSSMTTTATSTTTSQHQSDFEVFLPSSLISKQIIILKDIDIETSPHFDDNEEDDDEDDDDDIDIDNFEENDEDLLFEDDILEKGKEDEKEEDEKVLEGVDYDENISSPSSEFNLSIGSSSFSTTSRSRTPSPFKSLLISDLKSSSSITTHHNNNNNNNNNKKNKETDYDPFESQLIQMLKNSMDTNHHNNNENENEIIEKEESLIEKWSCQVTKKEKEEKEEKGGVEKEEGFQSDENLGSVSLSSSSFDSDENQSISSVSVEETSSSRLIPLLPPISFQSFHLQPLIDLNRRTLMNNHNYNHLKNNETPPPTSSITPSSTSTTTTTTTTTTNNNNNMNNDNNHNHRHQRTRVRENSVSYRISMEKLKAFSDQMTSPQYPASFSTQPRKQSNGIQRHQNHHHQQHQPLPSDQTIMEGKENHQSGGGGGAVFDETDRRISSCTNIPHENPPPLSQQSHHHTPMNLQLFERKLIQIWESLENNHEKEKHYQELKQIQQQLKQTQRTNIFHQFFELIFDYLKVGFSSLRSFLSTKPYIELLEFQKSNQSLLSSSSSSSSSQSSTSIFTVEYLISMKDYVLNSYQFIICLCICFDACLQLFIESFQKNPFAINPMNHVHHHNHHQQQQHYHLSTSTSSLVIFSIQLLIQLFLLIDAMINLSQRIQQQNKRRTRNFLFLNLKSIDLFSIDSDSKQSNKDDNPLNSNDPNPIPTSDSKFTQHTQEHYSWIIFDLFLSFLLMIFMLLPFNLARQIQFFVLSEFYDCSMMGLFTVIFLIGLIFSHFALMGMLLLKDSSPFFHTFTNSCSSLTQVLTYDSWSYVLRVSMLGCKYFGYDSVSNLSIGMCRDIDVSLGYSGQGAGWLAAYFFVTFIVVLPMVVMSQLVGIIIKSMEILREDLREEADIWSNVRRIQNKYLIDGKSVLIILQIFEMIDENNQGKLTISNISNRLFVLPMISEFSSSPHQILRLQHRILRLFEQADTSGDGNLDFAEFCELVVHLGRVMKSEMHRN